MERFYILLNTPNGFQNEELGVNLTMDKPAAFIDLSNINNGITQGILDEAIVQITMDQYQSSIAIVIPLTITPIIEDPTVVNPFIFAQGPFNVLPSFIDKAKYYFLGNSPQAPFNNYPQYVVRLFNDGYHVYKPVQGSTAIQSNTPSIYNQYFGIWPSGQWIKTDNTPVPVEVAPVIINGQSSVVKQVKDLNYATIDLNLFEGISPESIVNSLVILREGAPIYEGVDASEYAFDPSTKIITFNTPVTDVERIIYMVTLK